MASSPPAIIGTEPTWVPYEPTRDCSQGLCSMYCPQWCYFIFPPPPPFDLADPSQDDSSGHVFSPLVIAIIGVLATAFLLVSYYTFISKYCGTFSSLRGRFFGSHSVAGARGGGGSGSGSGGSGHGQSRSQESWNLSPPSGLDETLINKITVCKYRRSDGFVHTTDCSVCLGEFHDGESLRLLPKCSHAFHQQCIDTWLKSHSNCPLCRSNITFVAVGEVLPEPELCPPGQSGRGTHEVVVVIEDLENMCEEQQDSGSGSVDSDDHEVKDGPEGMEEANCIAEIREEGVPPKMGCSSSSNLQRDSRMSIADVLQSTMEDELIAARQSGLLAGDHGTSRRCRGENSHGRSRSRRALQDAPDSLPMKRLPPSGRSCLSSKSGRGNDSDHSVRGGQS
ncbi:E3 ubiquitin-protein ligase Os04g0590900-like [Lolium rigidum]|uniref:E3 ubiquitin-protein ligase Os04g0590900-like n=1 Tax=Lolium rigidum TaxID=89674 RepID=UPI001F5C4BED|nr:E3 ubiquitin-protein ligase Os04g0590900-like [Lolium rigidum]